MFNFYFIVIIHFHKKSSVEPIILNEADGGALLELFCTKEAIILYNEVIKYKNMNNYENFEKYS